MKIAYSEQSVERIGVQNENRFSIKATGKAFRILSSGLYKEKILAIVRELSCNAYDAHVDAGINEPFDVHLPNSFEPFFSIRDKGKGLSEHHMRTVYTTYFESTKTDDNNQIGGLGLGCKSPLCYVDKFTVTSYHEGQRKIYTVFFDETDTPSITLMSSEKSNSPSGLEVSLPVMPQSFKEFKEKAELVYSFFPMLPNVIGNPDFNISAHDIILKGTNFEIIHSGFYSHNKPAKAIMGVVAYPIDPHAISELLPTRSNLEYELLNMKTHIYFPVGDLDITAGREELSYDQRTKNNIVTRVKEVLEEIPFIVMREVQECKNEFEVRKYYGRVMHGAIKSCFPSSAFLYNGKLISGRNFEIHFKADFPDIAISTYDLSQSKRIKSTEYSLATSGEYKYQINACNDPIIIIDDVANKTVISRMRRFLIENPEKKSRIMVLKVCSGYDKNNENLNKFIELLEGAEFIYLSSLPKMEPIPKKPVSAKILENWWAYYSYGKKYDWDRTEIDASISGIYAKTVSSRVVRDDGEVVNNFKDFLTSARAVGLLDKEPIYAFPKSIMDNIISNNANWVEVFSHVRKKFMEKCEKENLFDILSKRKSASLFHKISSQDRFIFDSVTKNMEGNHPIAELYNNWKSYNSLSPNLNLTESLKIMEFLEIELPPFETDLEHQWAHINKRYPMMEYLMKVPRWDRVQDVMTTHLRDYIEIVDKNILNSPQE